MAKGRPLLKDYEMYTTVRGEEVKVHAVAQNILRGIQPTTPKPERPKVEMKTKAGSQYRWAKADDEEWEPYQEALDEWKAEKAELEEAVTLVLALRSYPFPEPLEFPDDVRMLVDSGLLIVSDNIWLKKAMFLRAKVLTQHDEMELGFIIQRLSGIPEELIDQMKENFRNILLGKKSGKLADGDVLEAEESEKDLQM